MTHTIENFGEIVTWESATLASAGDEAILFDGTPSAAGQRQAVVVINPIGNASGANLLVQVTPKSGDYALSTTQHWAVVLPGDPPLWLPFREGVEIRVKSVANSTAYCAAEVL